MRVWTALIRTTYTFIVYHFCLFYQIFLKEFTFSVYIRENLRYLLHRIYHSFLDFLSPGQRELKPHHLSTVFINKTLKFKSIVFLLFAKYFHSTFPLVLFVQFLVVYIAFCLASFKNQHNNVLPLHLASTIFYSQRYFQKISWDSGRRTSMMVTMTPKWHHFNSLHMDYNNLLCVSLTNINKKLSQLLFVRQN